MSNLPQPIHASGAFAPAQNPIPTSPAPIPPNHSRVVAHVQDGPSNLPQPCMQANTCAGPGPQPRPSSPRPRPPCPPFITHALSPMCRMTCGLFFISWSRVAVLLAVWPTSPMSPMRRGYTDALSRLLRARGNTRGDRSLAMYRHLLSTTARAHCSLPSTLSLSMPQVKVMLAKHGRVPHHSFVCRPPA